LVENGDGDFECDGLAAVDRFIEEETDMKGVYNSEVSG
jgi:hypothetical protein